MLFVSNATSLIKLGVITPSSLKCRPVSAGAVKRKARRNPLSKHVFQCISRLCFITSKFFNFLSKKSVHCRQLKCGWLRSSVSKRYYQVALNNNTHVWVSYGERQYQSISYNQSSELRPTVWKTFFPKISFPKTGKEDSFYLNFLSEAIISDTMKRATKVIYYGNASV